MEIIYCFICISSYTRSDEKTWINKIQIKRLRFHKTYG